MGAVCDALARSATAAGVHDPHRRRVARVLVERRRRQRRAAAVGRAHRRAHGDLQRRPAHVPARTARGRAPRHRLRAPGQPPAQPRPRRQAAPGARLGAALPGQARRRSAVRLLLAPSLDYIERAFNHSKYGEYSAAPALEVTVPTATRPCLAPAGGHVISAIVQYAPYALRAGWEAERERLADRVIDLLERYAPGLRGSVRASELLTPADIERRVPDHRRALAPRRTRLRPVLHAAAGPGRRPVPDAAAGSFTCAARVRTRAAA